MFLSHKEIENQKRSNLVVVKRELFGKTKNLHQKLYKEINSFNNIDCSNIFTVNNKVEQFQIENNGIFDDDNIFFRYVCLYKYKDIYIVGAGCYDTEYYWGNSEEEMLSQYKQSFNGLRFFISLEEAERHIKHLSNLNIEELNMKQKRVEEFILSSVDFPPL